ncbi:MAG: hypothetical protein ACXVPN_00410 [Bacteroidia bacterium]
MNPNLSSIIQKSVSLQLHTGKQKAGTDVTTPLVKLGEVTVITSIPSGGYTINTPGNYRIGNDITWTPSGILLTAITISSGNVTLDLGGFTITAAGSNSPTSFGIQVINLLGPCNSVTVQNGTLKNMGICGLSASNTNSLALTNLVIDGLSYPDFDDNSPSGISVSFSNSLLLNFCSVKNINIKANIFSGILLTGVTTGKLSNCLMANITNNDGVAAGYVYEGSSDIHADNCKASDFHTFYGGNPKSTIGHTCIGFMPAESENLTYNNCSATNITGCCDDCHGMSLFAVKTVTVTSFLATGITDGNGVTGAKATGLEVYGDNITIKNSHVENIIATVPQDLQSTGFSACGTTIEFDNCTAVNVKVLDKTGAPNTEYGYGTGFGWAPDPRTQYVKPASSVVYNNCTANNCQLGFDTWNHQNSVWNKPMTNNCTIFILAEPAGTKRTYSMNFCSELPNSSPSSPSQQFPIINCAKNNKYPEVVH